MNIQRHCVFHCRQSNDSCVLLWENAHSNAHSTYRARPPRHPARAILESSRRSHSHSLTARQQVRSHALSHPGRLASHDAESPKRWHFWCCSLRSAEVSLLLLHLIPLPLRCCSLIPLYQKLTSLCGRHVVPPDCPSDQLHCRRQRENPEPRTYTRLANADTNAMTIQTRK